ncbi:13121_t:CDS:2, partial [Dentiscutata erythropus]
YVNALYLRTSSFSSSTSVNNDYLIPTLVTMPEDNITFSKENFTKNHYDLIVRFNIFANQINSQEFPLENCLEMIKSMRGKGMDPSFETYNILLKGYSISPEFQGNNEERVKKALGIFDMIKSVGYDVDDLEVFQPLLDSCLQSSNRENINKNISNNFEITGIEKNKKNEIKVNEQVENVSFLHKYSLPKIFEIEKLMNNFKVTHNQKSIITILEYLGGTGNYIGLWRRWTELSLMGYRRSELLYETVLRLASRDLTESEYAINVIRHQMRRELPPIKPNFEIYSQLFKCCLKVKDILTIKDLIEEINNNHFDRFKFNKSSSQEGKNLQEIEKSIKDEKEQEVHQTKLLNLILNTCFKLPILYSDGEKLINNIYQNRPNLINYEFWKSLLTHYTDNTFLDDFRLQNMFENF